MLVGKSGSGKTTLLQRLRDEPLRGCKTQSLSFSADAIDTPGEYLERKSLLHALLVTATEADVILLVHSAPDPQTSFPPQMQGFFNRPLLGVVTKTDLAADEKTPAHAAAMLRAAGAGEVFFVSAVTGEGIGRLRERLKRFPDQDSYSAR